MYIVYINIWTEGQAVVRRDDKIFPLGYNPLTGGVTYVDTFEELMKSSQIILETEDIDKAVEEDTALYQRYPADEEEGKRYEVAKKAARERYQRDPIF